MVFGEVEAGGRRIALGIEGAPTGVSAKVAGTRVSSLAELAALLPVQVIDPEIHRLIEEGPSRRRRFLDWGVFHVEPTFVGDWQRYQQALKQRNAALRARSPKAVVAAWDGDLVRYGERLTSARSRYVGLLAEEAAAISRNLLGMDLALGYRSGWARDLGFAEALRLSSTHDLESGSTQVGPPSRGALDKVGRVGSEGPHIERATEAAGGGAAHGAGQALPAGFSRPPDFVAG